MLDFRRGPGGFISILSLVHHRGSLCHLPQFDDISSSPNVYQLRSIESLICVFSSFLPYSSGLEQLCSIRVVVYIISSFAFPVHIVNAVFRLHVLTKTTEVTYLAHLDKRSAISFPGAKYDIQDLPEVDYCQPAGLRSVCL